MLGDDAVTSPLAFTVSGLIFVAILAGGVYAASLRADDRALQSDADPGHAAAAGGLADILTMSPGTGWAPAPTWTVNPPPPPPPRPGLASTTAAVPGVLDTGKLRNLLLAPPDAAPADGLLNLEEFRDSLGLSVIDTDPVTLDTDDTTLDVDIHIRLVPEIPAGALSPLIVMYVTGACGGTEQAALDSALATASLCDDGVAPCPAIPLPATKPDAIVFGTGSLRTDFTACTGVVRESAATIAVAGGTVIVLSSPVALDPTPGGALEALQDDLVDSSSEPLSDRDPAHPLLTVPNALPTASWGIPVGHLDPLAGIAPADLENLHTVRWKGTVPLMRATDGGSLPDALVPTASGRILFAAVSPLDLDADGSVPTAADSAAARSLFENLLSRHYEHLFLDYGSAIPQGADSTPAVRNVLVEAPVTAWAEAPLAGLCGAPDCMRAQLLVYLHG